MWLQLAMAAAAPLWVAPEIHADLSVTFVLSAPKAGSVQLWGDWMAANEPSAMRRAPGGGWSITVPPLSPGAHLYCFWADGVRLADPLNRQVKNGYPGLSSILRIPEEPVPAPRGVSHVHVYRNQTTGIMRRLHVYTPAGYRTRRKPWPVLYLLHGSSDSDRDWLELGQAGEMLDRMIAQRRAVPMVLVMPDGHPHPSLDVSTRARNLATLAAEMRGHIMPIAEQHYGAARQASFRAIAGASMGGAQALHLAGQRPMDFGVVAGFSAPGDIPSGPTLPEAWPARTPGRGIPRFWLACGRDDEYLAEAKQVFDYLERAGYRAGWHLSAGGHGWAAWREHLEQLLSSLFQ